MSQLIALTGKYGRGRYTIVDDIDYTYLRLFRWHLTEDGYAERSPVGARKMHRFILNADDGQIVDHINGDKIDNRRCNLRIASASGNVVNRGINKNNTSGERGVSFDKRRAKWRAEIRSNSKKKFLGEFETVELAAESYRSASIHLHGEFSPILSRNQDRVIMKTIIID